MISLLLQTFLLLFFSVVYAVGGQPYFWYSCSCCWHPCGWRRLWCCWHGVPTISGIPASLYCSYSMMTVAGVPSVVDSPSVPSVRTVAGLPAFLSVLTSLQLLAFPAVVGVPAIASFPAVAVVSAVLVFFCCCWRSCRNFIMIFCPAWKLDAFFCKRFYSIVVLEQIYQRTKTTLFIVAKFRSTLRSEGQNHNPSLTCHAEAVKRIHRSQ